MDLTNLENALNSSDFKEQVYSSLEGVYQISKVLNQLDLLKNFSERDLEIVERIQAIKNALAGYEISEKELNAQISALMNSLEARKQELETRLNMELQSVINSETQKINDAGSAFKTQLISEFKKAKDNIEKAIKPQIQGATKFFQELNAQISALMNSLEARKQELETRLNMELQSVINSETQKINDAGSAFKTQLIAELTEAKDNIEKAIKPQIQGTIKFLGIYVYGHQTFFKNQSDEFMELFEFDGTHLEADKSYIVQFSMPYELDTDGIYSNSMGEMVLCLKANSKAYPIINSFYQNKSTNLNMSNKIISTYRINSVLKTPNLEAGYKIAVFARRHKDLWVNVNYTDNITGFETSFLNNAKFRDLTTQSIPITYNNNRVFYKHSQAIIYEILK
ncbi:hypothetical protein VN0635_13460 [Helicobacter pylori]